jgi:hypothetical protein
MKTVKKQKEVKLKNKYNGDIVFTKAYNEIREEGGIKFIQVYTQTNPNRVYLVNREAFDIIR